MTLTADVARAHAEAEGLTLVPSPTKSGFKGVKTHVRGNSFSASISVGKRKSRFLGRFSTPEAAALCCARAAEMQKPLTAPALTAPEVVATAAEEGLCLVRSSNATGFKSVVKHRNSFKAKVGALYLGSFRTAEEAAQSYSRHIGSARAAAEAAFHTADEVALSYSRHIGSARAAAEATNWTEGASFASQCTTADDSYNIAIKNRRGLSELSEARNSCCVAYLPDSCLYFQIATQIGRWELIAITR